MVRRLPALSVLTLIPALVLAMSLPVRAGPAAPAVADFLRPVSIAADGQLSGPGGDWLHAELRANDFFLFGEQHATADIARVATALFRTAAAERRTVAVVEVGPWATPGVEASLRADGGAALRRELADPATRLTYPFLFWAEELEFVAAAVAADPRGPSLWGLDQEFIGGARPLLDLLAARARSPAERQAVTDLQRRVAQEPMLLGTGDDAPWLALRDAFATSRDAEARRLIDDILLSRRVYAPFTGRGGSVVTANEAREQYIKANLLRHLEPGTAARWPRLFFKFGASHVGYGVSSTHQLSLGNFVREYGFAHGKRSFNLMVDCLGGQGMNPQSGALTPCVSYYLKPDSDLRGFAHADRPTLIDLRALRQERRIWKDWDEASRRLIESYDAWLALPEVRPAHFTATGTP